MPKALATVDRTPAERGPSYQELIEEYEWLMRKLEDVVLTEAERDEVRERLIEMQSEALPRKIDGIAQYLNHLDTQVKNNRAEESLMAAVKNQKIQRGKRLREIVRQCLVRQGITYASGEYYNISLQEPKHQEPKIKITDISKLPDEYCCWQKVLNPDKELELRLALSVKEVPGAEIEVDDRQEVMVIRANARRKK